ncbi:DNA polymerase III subunit gamma/tau [Mesomycoplasma lagogenitalium]|uniref:DNA-directed DNA polymerase n=1 Tax=Mesomycoplasma lagogenitalium TaxID=171286 RepID=A0ABY8LST9_9BACT|nr:DNA polymerase III subunit gamma/tau [Mesomycoplasma lagogenitalium]WGI36320.1 DNA polymerase III subunit gamma/tau [Mesomycoplasma lagogenitalium]
MKNLAYKAFYRTYRPKTFSEVQGQEYIIKTLENIIKNNRLSHAYLFSGPRGTGKTSVAKIFANTINCIHKNDILKPCDECVINIDRTLDIIEMDAASNNGVDEIRELKERIQNLPSHSKYKIYIIDEVHMLSKSAFNALLKTLEEPPKHIIFILATTDPHKIPLTILSRLQRFNFSKINSNVIYKHLINILDKENIKYENSAILKLSKLSDGGLRDALSMVEQVSIFNDQNITNEALEKVFRLVAHSNLIEILNLIEKQNFYSLIQKIKQIFELGADINLLVNDLITAIRDFLLFKKIKKAELSELLQKEEIEKINLSSNFAFKIMDILVELAKELRFSEFPFQLLELSLLKLADFEKSGELFIKQSENILKENENDFTQEIIEPKQELTIDEVLNIPEVNNAINSLNLKNTINNNIFNNDNHKKESEEFNLIEKNEINENVFEINEELHQLDPLFEPPKELSNESNGNNTNLFEKDFFNTNEKNIVQEKEKTNVFETENWNTGNYNLNNSVDENSSVFSKDLFDSGLIKRTTEIITLDNDFEANKELTNESLLNDKSFESVNKDKIYQTNQILLNESETEDNLDKEIIKPNEAHQEMNVSNKQTLKLDLDKDDLDLNSIISQKQFSESINKDQIDNSVLYSDSKIETNLQQEALSSELNVFDEKIAEEDLNETFDEPEIIKNEINVYPDLSYDTNLDNKINSDDQKDEILNQTIDMSLFALSDTQAFGNNVLEEDILTVDEVINLFGLYKKAGNLKDFKEKRKEQLANLDLFSYFPEYKEYIEWMSEVKCITASENFILVSTEPEKYFAIWNLNAHKQDVNFKQFLKVVFGSEIHFFAITKELFKIASEKWKRLLLTKTLPEHFEDLPEIKQKTEHELNQEKISFIFGDKFKK